MKKSYTIFFCSLLTVLVGCSGLRNNPLRETLKTPKGIIHQVMENPEEYEVQIIYSQIKRAAKSISLFGSLLFYYRAK